MLGIILISHNNLEDQLEVEDLTVLCIISLVSHFIYITFLTDYSVLHMIKPWK